MGTFEVYRKEIFEWLGDGWEKEGGQGRLPGTVP